MRDFLILWVVWQLITIGAVTGAAVWDDAHGLLECSDETLHDTSKLTLILVGSMIPLSVFVDSPCDDK